MRLALTLSALGLILVATRGLGDDRATVADAAALERKVAELESRLAAMREELREIRRQLKPPAMSPSEAVRSFERDAGQPVTVEFGVGSVAIPDGLLAPEQTESPLLADWDNWLPQGGRFTAVLTPEVLKDLDRTGGKSRRLVGRGIRVTGLVREAGGPLMKRYHILVDDPRNFEIIK